MFVLPAEGAAGTAALYDYYTPSRCVRVKGGNGLFSKIFRPYCRAISPSASSLKMGAATKLPSPPFSQKTTTV